MQTKQLSHINSSSLRVPPDDDSRYQALFEASADAMLIIEGNAFVDCNQSTLDMLQYDSKDELYQTHPSKLSPEFQPDGRRSDVKADLMIQKAFEKGSYRFEWNHIRKTGEIFPVEVLLTPIQHQGCESLHVVWRDITERKKAEAEIKYQALYDHLTGLANRKLLLDELNNALIASNQNGYVGGLLFIDLDRFKSINDSLGHLVGDALLVQAAKRISRCVLDEDVVSRFGGDEYVVLLKNIAQNKNQADAAVRKIAKRVKKAFETPFFIEGNELHLTVSIGITLFPAQEETVSDIIKYADAAMYCAKQNGRNQTAYYLSEMHEKAMQRLVLEKDLRNAVKEQQLDIHYQPQVDAHRHLVGVEALMRWHHPEKGFVGPDVFIPIAEESGLIFEMGEFLLHRAITDIASFNQQNNTQLRLSVNISSRQFKKPGFVGFIKGFVEKYCLPENFLTLELTESVAIDDVDDAIAKMSEIKRLGIKFSIDDFGTGYSSLSLLKKLPIDELKIDKSFVLDVEHDPQDALLVQSIIKIAQQFNFQVVAEGVENEEQLTFLQKENCDIYQGYFFGKPAPLSQLSLK